jgi:hypothetical protein
MPETRPQARNTVQVMVHLLPDDLLSLDAIAAEIAEPGMAANRSKAIRELIRDRMAAKTEMTPKRTGTAKAQ